MGYNRDIRNMTSISKCLTSFTLVLLFKDNSGLSQLGYYFYSLGLSVYN